MNLYRRWTQNKIIFSGTPFWSPPHSHVLHLYFYRVSQNIYIFLQGVTEYLYIFTGCSRISIFLQGVTEYLYISTWCLRIYIYIYFYRVTQNIYIYFYRVSQKIYISQQGVPEYLYTMVTKLKRNNLRLRSFFEKEMPLWRRRHSFQFILVTTVFQQGVPEKMILISLLHVAYP